MSIQSDLKSSITGKLDQAIIELHDYRAKQKSKADIDKTKEILENGGAAFAEKFPSRFYSVRFNPSQLVMDCSSKTKIKKNVQKKKEGNPQSVNIPTMTMSLQLYFDDMFTYDAFLWDRFNSVKGLTMLDAQQAVRMGRPFSVQQDVESFIAVLRNPSTRTVTFRWADFVFHGQLNFIKAQYTMFSPSGRPVRAVISLKIKSEMDFSALSSYYKHYASMFTNDGDVKRLSTYEQSVGSVLNISL